jgi:rubrerythrin
MRKKHPDVPMPFNPDLLDDAKRAYKDYGGEVKPKRVEKPTSKADTETETESEEEEDEDAWKCGQCGYVGHGKIPDNCPKCGVELEK